MKLIWLIVLIFPLNAMSQSWDNYVQKLSNFGTDNLVTKCIEKSIADIPPQYIARNINSCVSLETKINLKDTYEDSKKIATETIKNQEPKIKQLLSCLAKVSELNHLTNCLKNYSGSL